MKRRVLVFHQFAVQRSASGGTRHVEMFGMLRDWDYCIVASDRNLLTRRRKRVTSPRFRTVPTTPYSGSFLSRSVNWLSYSLCAFLFGMSTRPRPTVMYGSSPHLFCGLAAWAAARLRGAAFVLEVRDIWPLVLAEMGALSRNSLTYRALESLERFLYREASAIVVLAEGTRDRLSSQGVSPEKITWIPNGADPADFVSAVTRDEARTNLQWSGFVVLYAGAHGLANGLGLLLDAASNLRDEMPDVRFVLLGDGPEKVSLQRRAALERLSNVSFLASVPKSEMAPILKAADVGLHVLADVPMFRYGVSPNKVYDYMAAGLPVLTNTPGEVALLVTQPAAGLAVDPSDLADGVRLMRAATDEQRQRWGAAGRAFMENYRSRAALARRLETVLDTVAFEVG